MIAHDDHEIVKLSFCFCVCFNVIVMVVVLVDAVVDDVLLCQDCSEVNLQHEKYYYMFIVYFIKTFNLYFGLFYPFNVNTSCL